MSISRLNYIDNLRILLTILVILVHLAITYGAPGDWYFSDAGQQGEIAKILLTLFVAVNQSFFMGFFFMISSYFAPGSIDRKSPAAFLKDRLIRLGLPLLFYTLFLGALVKYSISRFANGSEQSFAAFYSDYLGNLNGGNVGPLWFVEFLLILSIFYGLWRMFFKYQKSAGRRTHQPPSNISLAAFAIGLGLVTFAVRLWMPRGTEFVPLHLQIPYTPQYIALFFVGILASRRNWFETISNKSARIWGLAVLALLLFFPVVMILGSGPDGDLSVFDGGANWQSLVAAMWEQMIGTAIIVVFIVVYRNSFNRQNRVTSAMSNGAYAAFIIHPLIIVPLAITLTGVEVESHYKFLIFAPGFVCLAFLIAYFIKQIPGVRSVV